MGRDDLDERDWWRDGAPDTVDNFVRAVEFFHLFTAQTEFEMSLPRGTEICEAHAMYNRICHATINTNAFRVRIPKDRSPADEGLLAIAEEDPPASELGTNSTEVASTRSLELDHEQDQQSAAPGIITAAPRPPRGKSWFTPGAANNSDALQVIFLFGSRFNHSCCKNTGGGVRLDEVGDPVNFLTAIGGPEEGGFHGGGGIKQGEEITVSYCSNVGSLSSRAKNMWFPDGCKCGQCPVFVDEFEDDEEEVVGTRTIRNSGEEGGVDGEGVLVGEIVGVEIYNATTGEVREL